jgi:hypothetical protein
VREGAACEAARHAPWAGRGNSAGCGQMHRSVGRGVPSISATAPVTIGEGSITAGGAATLSQLTIGHCCQQEA